MRVGMKISKDTVLAIQQVKELEYGDPDVPVTNGYLIGVAFKRIESKINNIPWEKLAKNEITIPNVTDSKNINVTGVHTTFNLEESINSGIEDLQRYLLNHLDTKRIYKSYVVKLILFAAILDYNNKL